MKVITGDTAADIEVYEDSFNSGMINLSQTACQWIEIDKEMAEKLITVLEDFISGAPIGE